MYDVSFFTDELNLIRETSPELATIVQEELEAAPAYFWTAPSSLSGNYHPWYDNGVGGICRHGKGVCYILSKLADAYNLPLARLVAAGLLHDLYKDGGGSQVEDTLCGRKQHKAHGEICAAVLRARMRDKDFPESCKHDWGIICQMIEQHMGRWHGHYISSRTTDKVTLSILALQIADVIASRKDLAYEPMVAERHRVMKEIGGVEAQ